jgi:hypothetical protein
VVSRTIRLEPSSSLRARWARYAIDLSELAAKSPEPGTLYRVTLSFGHRESTYPCPDTVEWGSEKSFEPDWEQSPSQASSWDFADEYYGEGYDWEQRENPCHRTFYMRNRVAARNFLASNVGLAAKREGSGRLSVTATDLLTAGPLGDASVEVLNYQHHRLLHLG